MRVPPTAQSRRIEQTVAFTQVGENIRALRKGKSLTLDGLASKCGLSISFLSAIERGARKPSLHALQRLSAALGVEAGWILSENQATEEAERPFVVRRQFRRKIEYSKLSNTEYLGQTDYLLSPTLSRQMAMVIMEFEPGGSSGDDLYVHEGEEVGYVLAGQLRLQLHDRVMDLEEGDSFAFEGTTPHKYLNNGDVTLRIILVNNPVIFLGPDKTGLYPPSSNAL